MLPSKVGCRDNASDLYWGGAGFLSWLGRADLPDIYVIHPSDK